MRQYLPFVGSVFLVLGLFSFAAEPLPNPEGNPEAGKASYIVCVACHMDNGGGNKILNSPAIAGQQEWYIARQLQYFKDGLRGTHAEDIYGAQMRPMSLTLTSDQAVADMASYVASMKPAPIEESTVQGDVEKGKKHYTLCATCHGPDGKGIKAMSAPDITLQQDWYVERQLKNFKQRIRGGDPKDIFGQQMTPMVTTLPDDQAIKDVVAYIMTLKK